MPRPLMSECKYCLEQIPAAAKKCRYCGEWQAPHAPSESYWQKAEIIGRILSILLIPVVLAVLGNVLSTTLKSRDVDMKMVEIATDILKAKPDESQKDLRDWAIASMDAHSRVPFSVEAKNALRKQSLNVQTVPSPRSPLSTLPSSINTVTVRTHKEGVEVSGVEVWYAAKTEVDLARI